MVSQFIVYGLIDPVTQEIRYVGRSTSGLSRPKAHFRPHAIKSKKRTHCASWVKSLHRLGLVPTIMILDEFLDASELSETERFYISYFKSLGCNLTNITSGGEGCSGYKQSKEHIRSRISKLIGKKMSQESKNKMSAAKKGKPNNNPNHIECIRQAAIRKRIPIIRSDGVMFESITLAALAISSSTSEISGTISGKYKQCRGFTFRRLK